MEKKTYFETPTQVMFRDFDNECWVGGIAYHNEIICGCCGAVIDLEELYDEAEEVDCAEPVYPYQHWVDISEEIIGDEYPEELSDDE